MQLNDASIFLRLDRMRNEVVIVADANHQQVTARIKFMGTYVPFD